MLDHIVKFLIFVFSHQDFDNALMTTIAKEFRETHGIDVTTRPDALQRLREACERAKIELDSSPTTTIEIPYFAQNDRGEPLHVKRVLSNEEYEALSQPLLQRTVSPSRRCLADAGISPSDIGAVVLVGGMTRMPAVRRLARDLFGQIPVGHVNPVAGDPNHVTAERMAEAPAPAPAPGPQEYVDPIHAVAAGAAVQGAVLAGQLRDVLLLDVAPLSLGIETLGGAVSCLIARNATLPCRRTEIFSTGVDNQTQVALRVFQGERPLAADNQFLGEFTLVGIQPAPRGTPRIAVTFDIDANGLVSVSAVDEATGAAHSIAIEPSGGLSPAQIEWMVQEAERSADADRGRKQRAAAGAEAASVMEDIAINMARFESQLGAEKQDALNAIVKVMPLFLSSLLPVIFIVVCFLLPLPHVRHFRRWLAICPRPRPTCVLHPSMHTKKLWLSFERQAKRIVARRDVACLVSSPVE